MAMEIYSGAFHLKGYLTLDEQKSLIERCGRLGAESAGLYTPTVRGGAKMRIQMLCLGMHWNPKTYRYELNRSDFDGQPAPELPPDLAGLAKRIAADVGMEITPSICIMNFYTETGRLGLHQDKDERPETLEAGIPVVSVSLGDAAKFQIGGTRRKHPVKTVILESGDAFVMGGPSRLRYHGVSAIIPGTAPKDLAIQGRFNLTFRQY